MINNVFDFAFLWGGLVVTLGYPFYYLTKKIRKYQKEKKIISLDLFSQMLILLAASIFVSACWMLPEIIVFRWPVITQEWPSLLTWLPSTMRFIELSFLLLISAYIFGHEYGERRWLHSSIGHIAVTFFGFIVDQWVGILFISLPFLIAYYSILYRIAIILLPTSDPEDRSEKWKRFVILTSYTWGIQFPLIVVDGHAWNKIETRIPGDFTWGYPVPGLVWTRSHQVVAITGGIKFKRIDGPGVVFTGQMERASQVFDLRSQLRTSEINVVSKDGMSFIVRVFTAFRMDPEAWDKETYDTLRPMNTILRGADKPSHTKGIFPYSNLRVQAALGVTSTKAAVGDSTIYWDQWAISVIENQTRKIISQKNLDELWRPVEDEKGANALDKIADEIKRNSALTLRSAGILLIVARVVNFHFLNNNNNKNQADEISKQQLATWAAEWERKRAQILDEAQAESEHAQDEARAHAESLFLNSIAEGLQKTKEMNPHLPRYVIAMRFLSTLQEYLHTQSAENGQSSEYENKIDESHNFLMDRQNQFFPRSGKEK